MGGCDARHGFIQVPPAPPDRSGDVVGRRRRMFAGFSVAAGIEALVSAMLLGPAGISAYIGLLFRKDLEGLCPSPQLMPNLNGLPMNLKLASTSAVVALSGVTVVCVAVAGMASAVVAVYGRRHCRINAYCAPCIRLRSNRSAIRASSSDQIFRIETDSCRRVLALCATLPYSESVRCSMGRVPAIFARGVRVRLGPRVFVKQVLVLRSQPSGASGRAGHGRRITGRRSQSDGDEGQAHRHCGHTSLIATGS